MSMTFIDLLGIDESKRPSNEELAKYLPSGSGFDAGCTIETTATVTKTFEVEGSDIPFTKQTRGSIIKAPFHHMDEHGGYCGWVVYYFLVVEGSIIASSFEDTTEFDTSEHTDIGFIYDIIDDAIEFAPLAFFDSAKGVWVI